MSTCPHILLLFIDHFKRMPSYSKTFPKVEAYPLKISVYKIEKKNLCIVRYKLDKTKGVIYNLFNEMKEGYVWKFLLGDKY